MTTIKLFLRRPQLLVVACLIFGFSSGKIFANTRQVDFNGDGFSDAAIGSPHKNIRHTNQMTWTADAGQVILLYGENNGLSIQADAINILNRLVEDVDGKIAPFQEFGAALATGDFNGDGLTDLAVGVPGDQDQRGSVQIFYSHVNCHGLCADSSTILHRDLNEMLGEANVQDRFGSSLAAGDFNGDGIDDIAIGVPGDEVAGKAQVGSVHIVYGTSSGLKVMQGSTNQIIHLNLSYAVAGLGKSAQAHDRYGSGPMASGDFNCDGYEDLAIGIPNRSANLKTLQSGAVHIVYGSRQGLWFDENQWGHLWQQSPLIGEKAESNDHFGAALIAGYFSGDSDFITQRACVDLAIGVPGESGYEGIEVLGDFGQSQEIKISMNAHGMVHILKGSPTGITSLGYQNIIPPHPYHNALFGFSLSMGNFNQDQFSDLLVGAPGEGIETGEGAVYLFPGDEQGLLTQNYKAYSQATNYILGNPEGADTEANGGDYFGYSLGAGNFDGLHQDEILVGVPKESYEDIFELGMVHELYLTSEWLPLTDAKTRTWIESECNASHCKDILSPSGYHAYDRFGTVLTGPRPALK